MANLQRLIDLIDSGCERANLHHPTKRVNEQIAEYLHENGVIVPPVKVGDTVYQTDNAGDIYESEVTQVVYNTKGIAFDERAIGKTVFTSREAAERAVKERQCY